MSGFKNIVSLMPSIPRVMLLIVKSATSELHSHTLFMGEIIDMRIVLCLDAEENAAQQALCELDEQFRKTGEVFYKQMLKERYCDKRQLPVPQYTTQSSGGGFVLTVNVPQCKPIKRLEGNSKKDAEQLAAIEALRQLKLS